MNRESQERDYTSQEQMTVMDYAEEEQDSTSSQQGNLHPYQKSNDHEKTLPTPTSHKTTPRGRQGPATAATALETKSPHLNRKDSKKDSQNRPVHRNTGGVQSPSDEFGETAAASVKTLATETAGSCNTLPGNAECSDVTRLGGPEDSQWRALSSEQEAVDVRDDVRTSEPGAGIAMLQSPASDALDRLLRNLGLPSDLASGSWLEEVESALIEREPDLELMVSCLPNLSQDFDIVHKLIGKLLVNRCLVIVGPDGNGKTTTALMLVRFAISRYFPSHDFIVPTDDVSSATSQNLIVFDDFLGRDPLDSDLLWKTFLQSVKPGEMGSLQHCAFLLTMRRSVFEHMCQNNADFLSVIPPHAIVTVPIDNQKLRKQLMTDLQMNDSMFSENPSIGFPLCCHLARYMPPQTRKILFHRPKHALRREVKKTIEVSDAAMAALALLAVTEGPVNTVLLLDASRQQSSRYWVPLQALQERTSTAVVAIDLVEFYRKCPGLVLMQEEFVSFTNEAIRDAVLVELCYLHSDYVAGFCTMKMLSRISIAVFQSSDGVQDAFLNRMVSELENRNYREVLTSSLLVPKWFFNMFVARLPSDPCVHWSDTVDDNGLPFLFYAAYRWQKPLPDSQMKDYWKVLQCVTGLCFWGYDSSMDHYYSAFKNKTALKKALKKATIQQIVSGDLPGLDRRPSPVWKHTPLYPEDTLLTMAARRGNDAVFKKLVFRDLDLNCQGRDGRTALMHYCARGNTEMVQFLLNRGADPRLTDVYGWTAVMFAFRRKEWQVPEELLCMSNGIQDKGSVNFLLRSACADGWSTSTIDKLIKMGGNVFDPDDDGQACLHHACKNGHTDVVAFLLRIIPGHLTVAENLHKRSPLDLALSSPGRFDIVERLLQTPAKLSAENWSAIDTACFFSDETVFRIIYSKFKLSREAKLQAMKWAAWNGHLEIVRYLHEHGKVGMRERTKKDGSTWLHHACDGPSLECVQFCVNRIDVNAKAKDGTTPLMIALSRGRRDMAELLLSKGAALGAKDVLNSSCMHNAILSYATSVLPLCFRELPNHVNAVDHDGHTPLMLAAFGGCRRAVRYLLDHGADSMMTDRDGNTSLHFAAGQGSLSVVHILVTKGCRDAMDLSNTGGKTPIQLAGRKGHCEVVDYLLAVSGIQEGI